MLFHSGIKSEATRKSYSHYLDLFLDHFIIKNHDKLLTIEHKKLQEMIEDYVMYEKSRNISASFIAGKICALKLFFSMNDVNLNWIKLQKMIPERTKPAGNLAYTTEQIDTLLKHNSHAIYRAIIHFMASSGVRVGSFQELKMSHLKDMPNGCKSVLVYADTIHEYHTFIHKEAVESLNEYLDSRRKKGEIINDDSWVFCSPRDYTIVCKENTMSAGLSRYVTKTFGRKKVSEHRYDLMSCHGFRKRFATVLKSNNAVNNNFAERLMGHSVSIPLDNSYFKPLLEQLFDEYQKAIPQLMINDKFRLQEELKKKDEEINKLNQKDNEIDMLKNTILEIKYNMLELQNKIKS